MKLNRPFFYASFLLILAASSIKCKRNDSFNPNDLVDARDGQRYSVVQFGNKRWMAQNLNYDVQGSIINPNNPLTIYGRLYTQEQAQIACPEGWHLPTDTEWKLLEYQYWNVSTPELELLGSRGGLIGLELKSKTGWSQRNGTNELEFNAYPAGKYNGNSGKFEDLGWRAYFWTNSDSSASSSGWTRGFSWFQNGVYREAHPKAHSLSCRCVED